MNHTTYIRFQAANPNRDGRHPGVFGLVNGLARAGRLTDAQEAFRRANNDWFHANFTNPHDVDESIYDRTLNPGAAAWFKATAAHLIDRVDGYLAILRAHEVPWTRVESDDPGVIIYEDPHQVVAIPHALAANARGRDDEHVTAAAPPEG